MRVIDARPEAARLSALFYQHIPAMGLRNYWHPVALSREITDQPLARTLMGDRSEERRVGKECRL